MDNAGTTILANAQNEEGRMAIDVNQLKQAVAGYQFTYAGNRFSNPPQKAYADFTSEDIAKMPTDTLHGVRAMMNAEQYQITDPILPRAMSRADFTRAVLRELARRNELSAPFILFPTFSETEQNKRITLNRAAFEFAPAEESRSVSQPQNVTERVGIHAIRDAAIDIIQSNSEGMRVTSDLAQQVGLQRGRILPLNTDAEAYNFGYLVGSLSQFRNDNGLRLGLKLPVTPSQRSEVNKALERMTAGMSDAQIETKRQELQAALSSLSNQFTQSNYCNAVDSIFSEGRAQDNRNALIWGMAQGRIDSRTGHHPDKDRVGLFDDCPPKRANTR